MVVINMELLFLKLLAIGGIMVAKGSQKLVQECHRQSTKMISYVPLPIKLLKEPKS